MLTCAACFARYSAAWPAELPPPTTYDVRARAGLGLADRRAVVDARADERLDLGHAEAAVLDAGGEHDGAARRSRCRRRPLITWWSPSVRSPRHVLHQQEVGAEHPGLLVRALRELGPADPAREAEVVADPRARPGLAADRLALDHERVEALGRGVHRGRRARPGPAPTITTS